MYEYLHTYMNEGNGQYTYLLEPSQDVFLFWMNDQENFCVCVLANLQYQNHPNSLNDCV